MKNGFARAMTRAKKGVRQSTAGAAFFALGLRLRFFLDFAFYGLTGRRRSDFGLGLRRFVAGLHTVFKTLHRTAQISTQVAQFLGAKNQHDNDQNDQPMPNAQ